MLTDQQKANRKNGIGATESSIILGLNPYMTPYHLWLIKTGKVEPEDISNLPQVYWGSKLEHEIADEYSRQFNCELEEMNITQFHSTYPFMLCHPDRLVRGTKKLLECKYARFPSDDWGPSGSDIVPMSYIIQIQHQLAVTGYEEADLAVLISGCDFRVYNFKRDETLINKIEIECRHFWDLVKYGQEPDFSNRDDVLLAYPFSTGNYKEADSDSYIAETMRKFEKIRKEILALSDEKKKLETEFALFIKEMDGIKINGEVVATWKARKDGARVLRVKGVA